jgi:hypothetical protein
MSRRIHSKRHGSGHFNELYDMHRLVCPKFGCDWPADVTVDPPNVKCPQAQP